MDKHDRMQLSFCSVQQTKDNTTYEEFLLHVCASRATQATQDTQATKVGRELCITEAIEDFVHCRGNAWSEGCTKTNTTTYWLCGPARTRVSQTYIRGTSGLYRKYNEANSVLTKVHTHELKHGTVPHKKLNTTAGHA